MDEKDLEIVDNNIVVITVGNRGEIVGYTGEENEELVIPFVSTMNEGESPITIIIGDNAFYDCDNISSVSIVSGVTNIRTNAFYDCDNLTSVIIGDTVTDIGRYAFYDCDKLETITISKSVTNISDWAFFSCNAVKTVNFTGTEEEWNTITIGEYNDCFDKVDINFNYIPE